MPQSESKRHKEGGRQAEDEQEEEKWSKSIVFVFFAAFILCTTQNN